MLEQESHYRDWESIRKMVLKLAHKVYGRVEAANLTNRICFEDLVQEGAKTWMIAMDKFDPERGVLFSTYLYRALLSNMSRYVDTHGNMKSDSTYYFQSLSDPVGDDNFSIEDTIIDERVISPEDFLCLQDTLVERSIRMSPEANVVYTWLMLPPDWLIEEINAAKALGERRKQCGFAVISYVPNEMDVIGDVLMKVWGLNARAVKKIKSEVRSCMK